MQIAPELQPQVLKLLHHLAEGVGLSNAAAAVRAGEYAAAAGLATGSLDFAKCEASELLRQLAITQ